MTTTIEYPKRITLKDVAAHAELSVAAVSMALRQHPSLPLVTINRVRALADELGYEPNFHDAIDADRIREKPAGYDIAS